MTIPYFEKSMDGTPYKYFAPYVNGDVEDEEVLLESYAQFLIVLEEIHGDQHNLDEIEAKLQRLHQHGSMSSYIA
ncbi:hypothetical protein BGX34_004532 [Mortierella sp. NVP85]|nr:hypothetical protein BGX34_004532 [Mortierella sp. NVP85]